MSVVLTALITKVIRSDNRHSGARVKRANPESRDSGFDAVPRPGMTETRNAGATVADPQCTCSHAPLSDTPSRSRRGFRARFGLLVPPPSSEGAGNAGRPMRPIAACATMVVERTRVSQVTPGSPGIPRAMVYGLLRALPGDRAFLSPSSANTCFRRLDASVEASEPHDFAVRIKCPRPWHRQRPPHPAPRP